MGLFCNLTIPINKHGRLDDKRISLSRRNLITMITLFMLKFYLAKSTWTIAARNVITLLDCRLLLVFSSSFFHFFPPITSLFSTASRKHGSCFVNHLKHRSLSTSLQPIPPGTLWTLCLHSAISGLSEANVWVLVLNILPITRHCDITSSRRISQVLMPGAKPSDEKHSCISLNRGRGLSCK